MEYSMRRSKFLVMVRACLVVAGFGMLEGSPGIVAAHATDVTVKVGVVVSLSPPGAYFGLPEKEAVEAFVKWNNAQNNGAKFDIVGVIDDKGDPTTGQAAFRRLLAQGTQAFVGDTSSAMTAAELPLTQQAKAIYMLSASWGNNLTGPSYPLVFRVGPNNNALATKGIIPYLKQLHQAENVTRVAVLADDTPFGADIAAVLKHQVPKEIPDMKLDVEVFPASSSDVTAPLLAIKKNDPQVLIIVSVTQAQYLAVNQAHEVGLVPPAAILAAWNYPEFSDYWAVVKENGVGVYYVNQHAPNSPLNAMGQNLADAIGHRPTIWQMWVWDACLALQRAALAAKSGDATAMAKAMEHVSFTGASGRISFTTDPGNYHNREDIPTYIQQTTKQGSNGADARVVFRASG